MASSRISILAITGLRCVLFWGLAGCAGQSAQTEKQLRGLEDRIAILQNERDRLDERVTALERQQQVLVDGARQGPPTASRPPLKVVRLSPDDESSVEPAPGGETPEAAANGSDSERTLISGSGTKLQVTQVTGAKTEERE